ncbi:hypothetical protein Pcinc_014328 [Petrolisthes cinctipes]|uniref:Uncharacterized protein n=1 Tax=Petrolisthes cinctipes TaxID=88211 RepID=A0AAE1FWU4_PETCI|nr:hypothetical protein Pcinc_014328 [Petrolisthes cinctipes]
MPLLRGQAHSVATVKHMMDNIKEIVAFLNPGQDSGWTRALVEPGIAYIGTTDSYLTTSSITRTLQMHQITACSQAEGASGVTEDPSALRRWMIAGPEVTHLVAQYEAACGTKEGTEHASHHVETE